MRRIAKQLIHQWTRFYQTRWEGFEQQAKAGWTRPWVEDNTLGTGLSQMVMSQVAGSLKGHMGIVQNSFAVLVQGSTLPTPFATNCILSIAKRGFGVVRSNSNRPSTANPKP